MIAMRDRPTPDVVLDGGRSVGMDEYSIRINWLALMHWIEQHQWEQFYGEIIEPLRRWK